MTDHRPLPWQKYCWCLNNGHGRLQAGKRSPIMQDGRQFMEYLFNRDIVERIKIQLDMLCVDYFDVVPDVDIRGSFLKGRVARANEYSTTPHPKIYLSVHANAASNTWSDVTGVETWHFFGSKHGKLIADRFQKEIVKATGWRDRGIKDTRLRNMYELRATQMPAIITESGFFSNEKQAADLMRDDVRQVIADAHVAAIMNIEEFGII